MQWLLQRSIFSGSYELGRLVGRQDILACEELIRIESENQRTLYNDVLILISTVAFAVIIVVAIPVILRAVALLAQDLLEDRIVVETPCTSFRQFQQIKLFISESV